MRNGRILISGAGIAGVALAYWLHRYGFASTLVERAPTFREGGYMIDFWGVGFDAAERMGLIEKLRRVGYKVDQVWVENSAGRRLAGFGGNVFERSLGDRFLSIQRADLARAVYDEVEGRVETIFGDSVVSLEETSGGMAVTFAKAAPRIFDLVVGADGQHSVVRQLAFGPEEKFEKYLGYCSGSYSIAHYPHRDDHAYVSFAMPGRQVSRYALRNDKSAFFFVFARDRKPDIGPHDIAAQKDILRTRFGRDRWELPEILRELDATDDFYFDAVSQIRMPRWSKGRVVLLGDAAFSPSLLAGQGAAFAIAAAYLLAGELNRARGDHGRAFDIYEKRFRPFMARKQKTAEGFAVTLAPKSHAGLLLRNFTLRLMAWPWFADLMMKGFVTDKFVLPDYA